MLQAPDAVIESIDNETVTLTVDANRIVQTFVTLRIFTLSREGDRAAKGMISYLHFMKLHWPL